MIARRVLAVAALFVVPIFLGSYFVSDVVHHRPITLMTIVSHVWILPYTAAAIEWLRLGNRISLVSRVLIVLTNLVMILVFLSISA